MAAATNQDFKIGTIGYYKRDNDMNVTIGVRPSPFNPNYKRLLELQASGNYTKDKFINLAHPEVIDDGNIENYFESLLNYISIEGFGEEKPRFVTNKQLLVEIAKKPIKQPILVFQYLGIIFISFKKFENRPPKVNETLEEKRKIAKVAMAYTHGANYAHYLTKESDEQEIPEDYAKSSCKAVMKCDISIGNQKDLVLYSAEIDAIDGLGQHVELKALLNGTDSNFFWKMNSCPFYWKLFFGKCKMMLIGDKTGPKELPEMETELDEETGLFKDQKTGEVFDKRTNSSGKDYPAYSLCKIEELKTEEIFDKMKEQKNHEKNVGIKWYEWSVEGGKNRVRRMLKEVKMKCSDQGVCFLGTEENKTWNFKKIEDGHAEYDDAQDFAKLVKTKMDIWKANFFN
ncbi:unnamed protein product [Caenorhabditis nigoni]